MMDEPNAVATPVEAPPPLPREPLTEAAFVNKFNDLLKHGEESHLNWLVIVIRCLFRRGVSMLDMALASVEKDIGSGIGKKG